VAVVEGVVEEVVRNERRNAGCCSMWSHSWHMDRGRMRRGSVQGFIAVGEGELVSS
jgi:hypothetical protein